MKNDNPKDKKDQDSAKQNDEEGVKYKQKIADLENQVKRVLADYQNLEKRVSEQRREWIVSANKDLVLRILPILDTIMLASKHSEDKTLKVAEQQFLDVLKAEGISRIKTEEQDFDPNTMEAIGTKEGKEGKVIEEARAGYMLNDTVLRVGQVIVGSPEQN